MKRRTMPSGGACTKPGAPDMCDGSAEGIAAAKAVCNRCPILDACSAWLRSLDQPPAGVVAGISHNSRGDLRGKPKRSPTQFSLTPERTSA